MSGTVRASKWDYDEVDDDKEAERLAASERQFDAQHANAPATLTSSTSSPRPAAKPHRSTRRTTPAKRPPKTAAPEQRGGATAGGGKRANPAPPPPAKSIADQLPDLNIPRPTLRPSRGDGTGFALGIVLYALGLNYLRYGWPGVTGWVAAKFTNRTMENPR
jgi:hypothetical protein